MKKDLRILGASIAGCVHVAGILKFLQTAKDEGFVTDFGGSALEIDNLILKVREFNPDILGISYRLSPESAVVAFKELIKKLQQKIEKKEMILVLGTTKSVKDVLDKEGISKNFYKVFTGGEGQQEVIDFLKGHKFENYKANMPPQLLLERIKFKEPFPLLRHHYGRPDFEETVKGIKKIADSGVLDIISLGPDQNTQEFFFHPEKMKENLTGAGGVPIRSNDDLLKLREAAKTGNFPIMRCYSGTNDIIRFAQVLYETIDNAWCAVPLCWYNELDNRSLRKLENAIKENQQVMKWHAENNIPVEVNESHHWSLRYASDSIAVTAAYLAAYNAKKMGVKNYVAQYMFNTPPETSFSMDLAKMLAKIEMIESLHDESFNSIRETRTGLFSMTSNLFKNKGQLASSTYLQMQLKPQIVHVVASCESEYAAKPDDIIESCFIVSRVIENILDGSPAMSIESAIDGRKKELIDDAKEILDAIKNLDYEKKFKDPLTEPEIIGKAIRKGILDAPHLKGVPAAKGEIITGFIKGACVSVDDSGKILKEKERLKNI
ncbi:MAG: methionine synthase [Actinomycetota bacterium]|nr:methionine synthase [Actinomycetota bacterium]